MILCRNFLPRGQVHPPTIVHVPTVVSLSLRRQHIRAYPHHNTSTIRHLHQSLHFLPTKCQRLLLHNPLLPPSFPPPTIFSNKLVPNRASLLHPMMLFFLHLRFRSMENRRLQHMDSLYPTQCPILPIHPQTILRHGGQIFGSLWQILRYVSTSRLHPILVLTYSRTSLDRRFLLRMSCNWRSKLGPSRGELSVCTIFLRPSIYNSRVDLHRLFIRIYPKATAQSRRRVVGNDRRSQRSALLLPHKGR